MDEELLIKKKVSEEKKPKKIWPIICIVFVIFVLIGGGYYYYTNHYGKGNTSNEVEKISLKDDFYESINYETINKAKIPSDSGAWSRFYDAEKVIEKRQEELTNEILADPNYKNEDIDIMIELYEDYDGRNKRGITELKSYLEMIDKATTIEKFNDVLITIDKDLDVPILINYESTNDFYDSSKEVLVIEPINIIENPFELFTERKYASYVPYIEKAMRKYFEVIGYSKEKAEELIKQIEEFIKLIQSKSIKQNEVTDRFELYKKYTLDEINREIKNIPIKRLLKELKVDKENFYIIPDMGHYKALDEYYTIEHLPLLKEFAKLQIIDKYLPITTEENMQYLLDMSNELNGTSFTKEEFNKKYILAIKSSYIMDEIQKRYEAKYFTDTDKKVVSDLVEDVKKYYKEVINKCDWLSETTKTEAIKKLENMKVKIGYQKDNSNDDEIYKPISKAKGGTLISNEIESNRFIFERFHKKFNKESSLANINTMEVNAYYQPQDNSINFLAGFKELYGNETDYYKMLGYFGTVISHEISHAFDSTGSKYDENGKVKNWWTEEDKTNYEKLTQRIKDYYSKYEFMGFKVDGKMTLEENIADLAAMKAIISIAETKGATNDDFKKIFESYADLWVTKMNKETAQMLSLSDTHSPNKVRVNGVLSSMDKFYEIYGIKEGDKMYISKENRVSLW